MKLKYQNKTCFRDFIHCGDFLCDRWMTSVLPGLIWVSVDVVRHNNKRPTSSDFVLMKTMKILIFFNEYAVICVYTCVEKHVSACLPSTRIWFLPLRSQSKCRVGVLCRSRSMGLFVHMSLSNGGSDDRLNVCVCVWQVPVETSYRLTAQCSPWHLNSS